MDSNTINMVPEFETVYHLSALDELVSPIAANHIFIHILDVSNPDTFLQSIRYWNRFNMVDSMTLAQALQLCFMEKKITFEIVSNGADKTMLHRLCFSRGNAAIIKIVLRAAGKDAWRLLSLFNRFGRPVFHYAVELGDLETVQVFLDWAEENNKTLELIYMKNSNKGFDAFDVAKLYEQRAVFTVLEQAVIKERARLAAEKNT